MNNEKRIAMEHRLIRKTIRILKEYGFKPVYFNETDGDHVVAKSEKAMMEAVFAVDMGTMCFQHHLFSKDKVYGIFVVLGESGWDSLNDWSYPERDTGVAGLWLDAMEEVEKYVDALEQEVERV